MHEYVEWAHACTYEGEYDEKGYLVIQADRCGNMTVESWSTGIEKFDFIEHVEDLEDHHSDCCRIEGFPKVVKIVNVSSQLDWE